MASSSADIHQVDVHQLASRLAPEVLDEAMADAREQARRRLAAALAEEIVAAALAGDMPAERPPAPTGTRLASSHRTRSRPGAAGTATSPATAEAATASPANTSPAPASPASADPALASLASADSARLADTRPAAQAAKPARERARPAAPAARGRPPRAEPTTGARSGEDHDEDHGLPPAQTGLYAYGITDAATDTRDIVGLDGRTPVETLPVGDTALVTSTIDLALLAGLESEVTETGQLSETGRLAELASRHDRVMRLLLDRGPVLPLRFGTVLPDRERARRLLRASADDLAGELDRVRGHREWGLRVTPAQHDDDIDDESRDVTAGQASRETGAEADGEERRAATRTGAAADDGATPTSEGGTGTAYLSARREELRRAALREERLTELTRRVHDQLAVLSSEVTIRSGRPGPGRLSAAYLIASAAQDEFLDAAAAATRELTEAGCEARLTGPWPPYSFVRLTLGEARDV